jgi:hypothetical protein
MSLNSLVDVGCGIHGPSERGLDEKHKKKNEKNLEKFEEERKQKEEKDTYTYRPFENAFNKNK